MPFTRSSGILLHPTSLPSRYGIGDFGSEAKAFVDFLAASGQRIWQVLPLGPTGFGDSPYMCFSAMAGNPLLISLELLRDQGWLDESDLQGLQPYPQNVDFGRVIKERTPLLRKAWTNFKARACAAQKTEFEAFYTGAAGWLDDYALFMALKEHYQGKSWVEWTKPLIKRNPQTLGRAKAKHAETIGFQRFLQYEFHRQISELKTYANSKNILIVGDLPIYVAHDSAEVWSQPQYFDIDQDTGLPHAVAGVPPDYFSATGQLWGNPLYNWEYMAQEGYEWWARRFEVLLGYVDAVRIDHFRGFEAYWRVPYGEKTAINGAWVQGPGEALFKSLYAKLGELPIIAEDLGVITAEVEALRDGFNLPGMKILQFAFGSGEDNPYLPHNYEENCVVYTGTHDNDTTIGWFASLDEETRQEVLEYIHSDKPEDIHWDLIRLAYASKAKIAIIPMQDILGLGTEARMNTPSVGYGNWAWRLAPGSLTVDLSNVLLGLAELTQRSS